MRQSRAQFVLTVCFAVAPLLAVGCSAQNDVAVSSELGLGGAVDDGSVQYQADGDSDEAALRGGADGGDASRSGAESTTTSGVPSPPTLSAEGLAAQATSTTFTPTSTSTTAPATTAPAPSTSSSTVATDSSTTSANVTSSSSPTSTSGGSTTPSSVIAANPEDLATGETHSETLLGQLRSSLQLSTLSRQSEMDAFARDWSRQMAESGNFEHSSGPYGENIAFTSNTSLTATEAANLFHQLWIDSPGHYQNMTNEGYTKIGIGLYLTDSGWYGTHVFSF